MQGTVSRPSSLAPPAEPQPEGWIVDPPPPDGEGVPPEAPVDPGKMASIREQLAAGRVEAPTSGGVAGRGVARRVDRELSRGSLAEAQASLDEDSPSDDEEFGDPSSVSPDPDDPDQVGPLDDDLDLPDVSELDGKGGNVSRPRAVQSLPPDHQPRMVEKVIRDPRLAAKMKAAGKLDVPAPRLHKGDPWGGGGAEPAPRVATSSRDLVIADKERRALEALLDLPLGDSGDLMRAVIGLSKVQVGGFSVELTQAEREEIARRAAYNHRSPEQEWAACFEFIKPLVFNAMVMQAGVRNGMTGKRQA